MSSDRIALVTGGAGGLGYSICTKLHEKGYRVLAYTVNDAPVAEQWFAAGIDGLVTDNLREFALRFPDALRGPA